MEKAPSSDRHDTLGRSCQSVSTTDQWFDSQFGSFRCLTFSSNSTPEAHYRTYSSISSSLHFLPKTRGFKLRVFMKWILLGTSSTSCIWPTLKRKEKERTIKPQAQPQFVDSMTFLQHLLKMLRLGAVVLPCIEGSIPDPSNSSDL